MAKLTKRQLIERDATISQFAVQCNHYGIPETMSGIERTIDWLHRQETTLHRLAEVACERELTRAEQSKNDRIESRVRDLLTLYQIPVRFEGDPRGGTIRMYFVSGASNNWGGDDWGIFW